MKSKSEPETTKQSRRKFLASLVRTAIGAGLAITGGYLLLREEPATLCPIDFACSRCDKLRQCILPEATAFRIRELQQRTNTKSR
ncbi:MAG: hypothetical protein D4R67_01100 [Bacteroidetes bacterium]|nr:MAG: hypothetical protein D4R67_01100 [Bacteroidota bacterium]